MDVTNPQTSTVNNNMEATIRVGSPQAAQQGAGDITVRPGTQKQDNDEIRDGDFVLKGRLYRGIKCLSDNSGEAQVFLVEGDEGERVLKVYYPNFSIKKGLMRIIQNFSFEMVVKITDYGKTYVDGKTATMNSWSTCAEVPWPTTTWMETSTNSAE
jgi:hypothetical protein